MPQADFSCRWPLHRALLRRTYDNRKIRRMGALREFELSGWQSAASSYDGFAGATGTTAAERRGCKDLNAEVQALVFCHSGARRRREPGIHNHETKCLSVMVPHRWYRGYGFRASLALLARPE